MHHLVPSSWNHWNHSKTQTNQVSVTYDPWNAQTIQWSHHLDGSLWWLPALYLSLSSIQPLLLYRSSKAAQIYFSSLSLAVVGQMGYVITLLCSGSFSGSLLSCTWGYNDAVVSTCCGLECRLTSKLSGKKPAPNRQLISCSILPLFTREQDPEIIELQSNPLCSCQLPWLKTWRCWCSSQLLHSQM